MVKTYNFIFVVFFALLLASCNKKDDETTAGTDSFRKDLLTNVGNNIIVPGYQELNSKVDIMDMAVKEFQSNPTASTLNAARNTFKDAYRAWQKTSVFEFGPAEVQLLRESVNTFPTNTEQIHSNIASGTYNLGSANNFKAKGFPALDYLLYGLGENDDAILEKYIIDEGSENRLAYLEAVSKDIKSNTNVVLEAWSTNGGNYINTFVNATGTANGSSLSKLVNQLNYDYELIKNPKIGIPLGKRTLGEKLPGHVEAYYSGISKELTLLNVKAIENIYLGRSAQGMAGTGLDDYLVQLDAKYNGGSLSEAIKEQLTKVKASIEQLPDPLSGAIVNNSSLVEAAYTEIQKTVVMLKTDMPSAMSVQIDYVDNDGD
ncbi:MAG: imelysin family protein [Bacteroidota bacterium]|nr:imelysin family protein [Bacteroidota bacterium]